MLSEPNEIPIGGSAPDAANAALVLFSGGQDSAICLADALARFARVETVGFDYGQRHRAELRARQNVRDLLWELHGRGDRLGADHVLDLNVLADIGGSALTSDAAIALRADGLPSTFVPGRNLMFFTAAAALGVRRGITRLIGGMCEADFSGYPDCRDETLRSLEATLRLGFAAPLTIETPLMRLSKAASWALAERLGGWRLVDIVRRNTLTCYLGDETPNAWGMGCGRCPACGLRAKGYAEWRAAAAPVAAHAAAPAHV